jgi:hypothetical protein
VTEVSLRPDLLAHKVEILVDEEEVRGRACGGRTLEHPCCVHDTGCDSRAAFWKRVAEDGGQEDIRQVVEIGLLRLNIEVVGMIDHLGLHLMFKVVTAA